MKLKIVFPITPGELIVIQERLLHRSLKDWEKELAAEAAEIINSDFEDGQSGAPMFDMEAFLAEHGRTFANPACRRFWNALSAWRKTAYHAGYIENKEVMI